MSSAWLLLSAPSEAQSTSRRVSIQVDSGADGLLEEALVRLRGELFAMGLEADVVSGNAREPRTAAVEQGLTGSLIVQRDGPWIRIRAFAPSSSIPAVQQLDTRRADVTAEVVAVRAVEALRAVMSERREPAGEPRRAPLERPKASQEERPNATPPRSAFSFAPRDASALSAWLAPTAVHDFSPRRATLGAEVGAFWGRSGWFGGAQLGTSLVRMQLDDAAGQAYVRRTTALARFGFTFALSRANELWLLAGVGLAHYGVNGKAAPGYVSASGSHDGLLLAGAVGSTVWFSPHVGAYARAELTFAPDAAVIRVASREIATLDRPSLTAALGLTWRVPQAWLP